MTLEGRNPIPAVRVAGGARRALVGVKEASGAEAPWPFARRLLTNSGRPRISCAVPLVSPPRRSSLPHPSSSPCPSPQPRRP